jgi:hypothetical protein
MRPVRGLRAQIAGSVKVSNTVTREEAICLVPATHPSSPERGMVLISLEHSELSIQCLQAELIRNLLRYFPISRVAPLTMR